MRDDSTSSDMYSNDAYSTGSYGQARRGGYQQDDWYDPASYPQGGPEAPATPPRRLDASGAAPANPVVRAAGAVGSFFSGIVDRIRSSAGSQSQRRPAMQQGDDYLGSGSNGCRVCGLPVDATQPRCPHCGAFQTPLFKNPLFLGVVIGLVLIITLLSIAINACTHEPVTGIDASPYVSQDSKSKLRQSISFAQERLNSESVQRTCTVYSLNNLQAAVNAAEAVNNDSNASDAQVDVAVQGINDAINNLVPLKSTEEYEWPSYDDVRGSFDYYLGSSIAMEGNVMSIEGDGTTFTAYVAAGGYPELPIAVQYTPDVATNTVSNGSHIYFYGTVASGTQYTFEDGTVIDIPVIVCDFINVA